jgi:hypothetical protein
MARSGSLQAEADRGLPSVLFLSTTLELPQSRHRSLPAWAFHQHDRPSPAARPGARRLSIGPVTSLATHHVIPSAAARSQVFPSPVHLVSTLSSSTPPVNDPLQPKGDLATPPCGPPARPDVHPPSTTARCHNTRPFRPDPKTHRRNTDVIPT